MTTSANRSDRTRNMSPYSRARFRTDLRKSRRRNSSKFFCQPLGSNAQYVAVLARAFPDRLKKISAAEFEQVLQPIGRGGFNTLSAAYAVSALKSYSHAIAPTLPVLSIAEIHKDKREIGLTSGAKLLQRTAFSN